MIVYRIQASTGDSWITDFAALKADALRAGRELAEVYDAPAAVRVDELEIPPGRAGLVEALKLSGVNRINWPGREVWRS